MRKFLTQTFKHGIEDQYKKLHGSSCSRSLSFCRDLCFLPHNSETLKLHGRTFQTQDFSAAFGIDRLLLMDDDHENTVPYGHTGTIVPVITFLGQSVPS